MKPVLFFLLVFCFRSYSQDTTRILFIGNSFTYYNSMPQMVKSLADSAKIAMTYAMHAPPGISVGDTVQGTQAHMNNPILYSLIRSKKWDVVVIQDNQGRFVRDSAQFPASSKVVEGHLRIMDSVKAVNDCAKIVLFCGWAFKNGSPPFGNTGIEMIQRISRNYIVLNDTMKEVIAPIGEAWIKGVNYLSSVNLWDPDDAHPSYAGSYLTASVIFSTIFNQPSKTLNYTGSLPANDAYKLRAFADTAVFDPQFHVKYNLGGMQKVTPYYSNGQLTVPGNVSGFTWYKNGVYAGNSATLTLTADGSYKAIVQEQDGCLIKTCTLKYKAIAIGIAGQEDSNHLFVYPNPVIGDHFVVGFEKPLLITNVELFNLLGMRATVDIETGNGEIRILTKGLATGCYLLQLTTENKVVRKRIVVE